MSTSPTLQDPNQQTAAQRFLASVANPQQLLGATPPPVLQMPQQPKLVVPPELAAQLAGGQQAQPKLTMPAAPTLTMPQQPKLVMPGAAQSDQSTDAAPAAPKLSMSGTMPQISDAGDDPNVTRLPSQGEKDQARLNYLKTSGSGIDQIHNPFLRGLARVGDITADAVAGFNPVAHIVLANTPGTTMNHNRLVNQATATVGRDQAQADEQAQIAQRQGLATQEQAKADALQNPKPTNGQLLYDKAGNPIGFQDDNGQFMGKDDPNLPHGVNDILSSAQRKQPTNAFELWQQQNPKGTAEQYLALSKPEKDASLQQQYSDALQSGDASGAQRILKVIHDTSVQPKIDVHTATERPEASGTWTPGFDANKNPVMFNSKTGEVKPMEGNFTKTPKISSDEQKRADLAQNMNENIDAVEDILNRRPDLFGKVSGRYTELRGALGSDDPDVAKLYTLEHQLGMVAQGAHGMRSAQGVESSANSLINGFKNSPAATKAALESARTSVQTFLADSQQPGQARTEGTAVSTAGNQPAHSLATAMALPFNQGKSAAQVTADLKAHGYTVVP